MPNRIYPPACLMDAFHVLFPTLDFSRISFYEGMPFPLDTGQGGITIASVGLSSEIKIYLTDGRYNSCTQDTFLLLSHELVHALQIQNSFLGGKIPGWWVFGYVTASACDF